MGITLRILLLFYIIRFILASLNVGDHSKEDVKIKMLSNFVVHNIPANGRNTFLFVGVFPNLLYTELSYLNVTFTVTDIERVDEQIEDVVPYPSNTIIINCDNFTQFQRALFKVETLPYWHPLANIILIYHQPYEKRMTANIFFAFWYFKAANAVIINFDDINNVSYISFFNPYMSDYYTLESIYGCWTSRKVTIPVDDFETGAQCVEGCHNVTIHSKLRINNLGTCIGFHTFTVKYSEIENVRTINVFEDKSQNYHNYTMLSFAIQIKPFLEIETKEDGSYKISKRDGMIWNTMAEMMNFSMDISINKEMLYESFNYEMNIREIIHFTQRKRDLLIFPLYQFDLMVIDMDNTVPFVDSGVCLMSHRAGYETIVFDSSLITNNCNIILEFIACFICIWLAFIIFTMEQTRKFSLDQIGKDFVNAFRTTLLISLHKPPKRGSFKIFLIVAIWGFFIINFTSQAAIISLFSVVKKGREIDTFDDILSKGYHIEGIASPDVLLPDNEERFRKINGMVVAVQNMFICPSRLKNDSARFCIIDCSFGRYLERSWLNEKGEQYLHVAKQDRIHSHYLQMILHKHSPMTDRYNKYMQAIFEAGLVNKWIDYRFKDIKEETPVKVLAMKDLIGVFQCFGLCLCVCILVFICEIIIGSNLLKINY